MSSGHSYYCSCSGNTKKQSMEQAGFPCSESTIYNLFRTFAHNQSHIRQYLTRSLKPPDKSKQNLSAIQTIQHLSEISSVEGVCPIARFQFKFQVPLLPNKVLPVSIR